MALSRCSRRVGDAAAVIVAGTWPPDLGDTVERIRRVADRYRSREVLEPAILLTAPDGDQAVAIEGHTRLTAWALSGRTDDLSVIVGTVLRPTLGYGGRNSQRAWPRLGLCRLRSRCAVDMWPRGL